MDGFARLRQKLYLQRSGDLFEDAYNSAAGLGRALIGTAADEKRLRDTFLAAALRYSDDSEPILELIPSIGTNPYFDRYLSDALRQHPDVHQEAEQLITGLAGRADDPTPFDSVLIGAGVNTKYEPQGQDGGLGHPVRVIQCMFHGDPARSGRGNSGGIAILLTELGTAMAEHAGGVVTLVHYNNCTASYRFLEKEGVASNHTIIRMAACLQDETSMGFLLGRNDLRLALVKLIRKFVLTGKIFHVRFLDDASLEVARLVSEVDGRLVATITPDPHRQVCDAEGCIRTFDTAAGLEILNKVLIGDELVERAHGLLAIGKQTIQKVLLQYYPQLEDTRGRLMAGIDEGVRVTMEDGKLDLRDLLTRGTPGYRLALETVERPAILSVGRLAEIKNQVSLVEAWSRDAWRTHNLVLVGGDLENPSAEEREIIGRIRSVLEARTALAGRFCHLPGAANTIIRQIQAAFAGRSPQGGYDIYICPSRKEEFGLSILEAMAAGMIVCAPILGGAGTYIRHGVNGFLIDTRTASAIAAELTATVLAENLHGERVERIRENARATIARDYSVERIAGEFAHFYTEVMHGRS